ncbi:EamA-like transporter family protein [mine drainage metagenome]|uniref:EamA-like transporter family protein n=1 Tax=mine drainage metagenome TaxID=410659 RepID=A0A1J5TQK8_9ZZZZ
MAGAFLTLIFFAVTAVFAGRSALLLGPVPANLARLVVAALVLGSWVAFQGGAAAGPSVAAWLFLSGVAGFGLGGLAMFQALPRLGASLSMLIVQCLTVWVAAGGEAAWLGTRLGAGQWALAALTVLGVAIGLMPSSWPSLEPRAWRTGVAWALVSALGQGLGAVISRKAYAVAHLAGRIPDPGEAAWLRVLGGLGVAAAALVWCAARRRRETDTPADGGLRRAWPWVAANALTGPVLGVACYQWALSSTPAGLVQPVVSASPLLTIPFALWLEGRRPKPRYYAGAVVAVAGVVLLSLTA